MAILSIIVNGRKVRAALVDENYKITAFDEADTTTEKSPAASAAELALALLAKENSTEIKEIYSQNKSNKLL